MTAEPSTSDAARLSEGREAFAVMERGEHFGKIVLIPQYYNRTFCHSEERSDPVLAALVLSDKDRVQDSAKNLVFQLELQRSNEILRSLRSLRMTFSANCGCSTNWLGESSEATQSQASVEFDRFRPLDRHLGCYQPHAVGSALPADAHAA